MKKASMLLKVIFIFVAAILIQIGSTEETVANQKPVRVAIDGEIINPGDQPPYIYEGRVFVPLRVISDHLGAKTSYNNKFNTVIVEMENKRIELTPNRTSLKVNNSIRNIDVAPRLTSNERIVVPLRFMVEAFGYQIGWDQQNQVASIFTNNLSVYDRAAMMYEMPNMIEEEYNILNSLKIGMMDNQVRHIMGNPVRTEIGYNGLQFWTYHYNYRDYFLFGFDKGRLVFVYTNAPSEDYLGVSMGEDRSQLEEKILTKNLPAIQYDEGVMLFLYDNNKYSEKVYTVDGDSLVIYYLDQLEGNKVLGINIMHKSLLVKGEPIVNYTLTYFGGFPDFGYEKPNESTRKIIERALERQIFDITNAIRVNKGLEPLSWHQATAQVAYEHSKDMQTRNYFDHNSPNGDGPGDRIRDANIDFIEVRENIAMNQINSVDVTHAWMNSEGHREAILYEQNTHLGVGVSLNDSIHYTQLFLVK